MMYKLDMLQREEIKFQLPNSRNSRQRNPVPPENKQVRDRSMLHRIFPIPNRFLHVQPPKEHSRSRNDTKPKRKAPNCTKVIITESAYQYPIV